MKLHHDFFSNTLFVSNSDVIFNASELTEKLHRIFYQNPYTLRIEISGLDPEEITDFHNALISVDNRPTTLREIHYQLERNAEQTLKYEFKDWPNLKFYSIAPASVSDLQTHPEYSDVVFGFSTQEQRRLYQTGSSYYIGMNHHILSRATTKEGMETGLNFHIEKNFKK